MVKLRPGAVRRRVANEQIANGPGSTVRLQGHKSSSLAGQGLGR